MNDAEGYDVLRLIEHNRNCYISSDYVEGVPLIRWLKHHPDLSKEQLFLWIHEMAKQLECIHKCRGKPCYRYVNPYSMIITKDNRLYFLDVSAEANEELLSAMGKRNVREYFLPPKEEYSQKDTFFPDIYGLGRTIQYLLSESRPDPRLTKKEEIQFQNILFRSISIHSKRTYTGVSGLRKQLPVYHKSRRVFKKIRLLLIPAAFLVFLTVAFLYQEETEEISMAQQMIHEKKPEKSEEERKQLSGELKNMSLLRRELGFLYFLDKKDYRKSHEYFAEDDKDKNSKALSQLSEYMLMGHAEGKEAELQTLLGELEDCTPQVMREEYGRCLVRGYMLLDSVEAAHAVLRLGDECMEYADEEAAGELTAAMAVSYERLGETGNAIEKYSDMLAREKEKSSKEKIYEKLIHLCLYNEEPDRAQSICRQGIDELKEALSLRLLHIRMLCADKTVKRRQCARTIEAYIREMPEIIEEEDFKTMSGEYGITMKGEKVCVER